MATIRLSRGAPIPVWRRIAILVPAWPVAAFFCLVGWYKTFATLAELQAHNAWTTHIPMWLGRAIGVSELAGALALIAAVMPAAWRWTRLAAIWLAATQLPSSILHWQHGEAGEIPKNLVLVALLALVAWLANPGATHDQGES